MICESLSHKNAITTNITSNLDSNLKSNQIKSLELKMKLSLSLLTSSVFCTTIASAVDTQKRLRGATVLASYSKYNPSHNEQKDGAFNLDGDLDSTNFAAAPFAHYDQAYIHKGCAFPNYPKWCQDQNCKGWPGWYCNDGQPSSNGILLNLTLHRSEKDVM